MDESSRSLHEATLVIEQERNMFIRGPVVVFKWKNAEGWPVEYVSPNVQEALGYATEEWTSGRIAYADCIAGGHLARVAAEVATASQSGVTSFNHEPYPLIRKDGRVIWVDDYTTILRDESGEIRHYLGYIVDISVRMELISQLEDKAHKLEEAHAKLQETTAQLIQREKLSALGELAAGVAHELNQPLNGIKMICQSLSRKSQTKDPDLDEFCQELLEAVRQVDQMAAIVDHMRLYSRSSTTLPDESVDMNAVAQGPLKIVGQLLRASGIEVAVELAADCPSVVGNAIRLEQVVMNLLTNARNALERSAQGSKQIAIRTGALSAEDSPLRADSAFITVQDNGAGFDDETAAKMFDRFFTTTKPGQGTGLGLSISKSIIEEHRGCIEFEGTPGAGATFRVVVPAS